MRRLTAIALFAPVALLSGCANLSLPRIHLPQVRPYERVGALRPALATGTSSLLAANTLQSREAEEGAGGATLEPPPAMQDQRVELVQQRDDGVTRTVDGTSLLARANFGGDYSAAFSAAREQVRESSPDVQDLAGGVYREDRTRYGLELAAREGRGRYTLAYLRDSSDDDATRALRVGLTQNLFRDQTRLTLAWDRSQQDLERRGDASFRGTNERRGYLFAVSHLLTQRLELGATVEGRSATGYLADPYRTVRYVSPTSTGGYARQPERVPDQRSSDALTLRGRYALRNRSTVGVDYRYYQDNWGIAAHTLQADYLYPLGDSLLLEAQLRHHRQDGAHFHQDLLAARGAANGYYSRNPALATLQTTGASLGFQWKFLRSRWMGLTGGSVYGRLEHRRQHFDDYRDSRTGLSPGTEPLYRGRITQLQLGVSATF
ncbi:MAG: hypothetical protein RJB26_160 [Pseudomonadota bacterium]|jgi:hypothetical protein